MVISCSSHKNTVKHSGADTGNSDYRLVFKDTFSGPAGSEMDTSKWTYRDLGPRKAGINIKKAIRLDGNGHLVIRTFTKNDSDYTGMIRTKQSWKYGKFEARIDFDGASGVNQAFWMQTPTIGDPMGNPSVAGIEVDIIEHRKINGWNHNANISGRGISWLHWDGYGTSEQSKGSGLSANMNLDRGFHTIALKWTPTVYKFYYDNQLVWSADSTISDRPEYLVLSAEVQYGYPGKVRPDGYGSFSDTDTKMIVDWVKIYQKSNTSTSNNKE